MPSLVPGERPTYSGITDAGWSSSVARWAHNPEVAGSNPAPATTKPQAKRLGFLLARVGQRDAGCLRLGRRRWPRAAQADQAFVDPHCPAGNHVRPQKSRSDREVVMHKRLLFLLVALAVSISGTL